MDFGIILTAVRYVLIALGTALLVNKGILDDATLQSAVGAILTLATVVWGIFSTTKDKEKAKAAETVLKAAPSPVSEEKIAEAAAVVKGK